MTEEENSVFQALTADMEVEYQKEVEEWTKKYWPFVEKLKSMPKPRRGEPLDEWMDRITRWTLEEENREAGLSCGCSTEDKLCSHKDGCTCTYAPGEDYHCGCICARIWEG